MPEHTDKSDAGPSTVTRLATERTGLATERTDMATERTDLSVERTRLAYDRTLMAWVRTATSLITFGFTIYKFFQFELKRLTAPSDQLIGPREFGLMMISIGLISLLFATLEHRRDLLKLSALYPSIPRRKMARVVAALVTILGILALATAILRE